VSNNTSSKAKSIQKGKDGVFGFPGASQTFYRQKANQPSMSYAQEYQQMRGNSMSKSNMYGNPAGPKPLPMEQLINQYNQIPI
jgi:hypothetical protein